MRKTMRIVVIAGSLLATPVIAQHGQTPPDVADRAAVEAIAQLKSPFGPHMLDMCPNEQAEELREKIHRAAREGATSEQLVDQVLAEYGQQLRAVPERRGFGWLAWLATPVALVAGAAVLMGRVKAMRGQGPAAVPVAGRAVSDDERAALAVALRDLDRDEEDEP